MHPVAPVLPVDPVDPVDPVEPVDPVDPVGPVDPVDPVGPVDPVDPVEPVDPVDPVEPVEPVEQVEWGEKQPRTRCLKKEGKKFHHVPIDGETDNNKHYDPPLDDADCNNKCIGDNDEYGCRLNCINSKYNDECDNECNGTGNPIKKHECRINCFNRKYEDACKKECIEHKDVCKGINYIQRGYFKKCEAVKDCTSNGDNLGMFRELKQNYQKKVN